MLVCPKIIKDRASIEAYKVQLRWEHALKDSAGICPRLKGMDAYQAARDAAWKFWPIYERVNREFCPNDPVYSITRTGFTPAGTAHDLVTMQTPASRKWRLLEFICGVEATVSATKRMVWSVSTGGTTETAGNVPEKFDIDSPASMFGTADIVFAWTTQPTLSGQPKVAWAGNELSFYVDWKAQPGAEIYHRNSEQVSLRNQLGTVALSFTTIHEEM